MVLSFVFNDCIPIVFVEVMCYWFIIELSFPISTLLYTRNALGAFFYPISTGAKFFGAYNFVNSCNYAFEMISFLIARSFVFYLSFFIFLFKCARLINPA